MTQHSDPNASALHLTDSQRAAVRHVEGPLLILAGPGSGKTRVVTHRIAHLIEQGVAGRSIAALTFTNKAADEMRQRLARLVPGEAVWIGTFHRFCSRLLRQYATLVGLQENFSIFDDGESRQTLLLAFREAGLDPAHTQPDGLAREISWAKRELITPEHYAPRPGNPLGALVARVYPLYQRRLQLANGVDFDDLLLHVGVLLQENPELRQTLDARFRFILVDEYQDTNFVQYAIVRALSIDYPNLAVTGDPDQCIYGWRGANLDNILNFERDFPQVQVVRLEQNYRSTPNILNVADVLISHNVRRKPKRLLTERPPGDAVRLVVYANGKQESEDIADQIARKIREGRQPHEFAVFYRTNALSRTVEDAFLLRGIPYQVVNGLEFYQRREIKDVLAYLHLLNNPRHDAAFRRIVNTPPRGIGRTTLGRLEEYATYHRLPLLQAAREAGQVPGINKRAATAVGKFVRLYDQLAQSARSGLRECVSQVLEQTEYRQRLEESGLEEDQDRAANVEELLVAAQEFETRFGAEASLEAFLEQTALVADTDNWEGGEEKVSLMTLHAAKGLEFPVVYIIALEEGLLPHERSRHEDEKLEEERRLLFVGITRAETELQLSMARRRALHGDSRPTIPSTFLLELPRDELQLIEHAGDLGPRGRGALDPEGQWDDWDDESSGFGEDFEADGGWEEPSFDIHAEGPASASEPESDGPVELEPEPEPVVEEPETPPAVRRKRPASPQPRSSDRRGGGMTAAGLKTASEMLPDDDTARRQHPPQAFRPGMLVLHPQYGPGKIVGISGSEEKRMATVQFFGASGTRKFRLAFSPLQPLASPS